MAKRTISKSDEGTTTPTRRRKINGDAAAADMAPKTPRTRKKAETAPVVSASSVEEIPAAPAPVAASAPVQVSHEQIAVRAYHLYLARGGRGGDQFQDWIVAERELRSGLVGASR
jgi:hypothetical protein